MVTSCVVAKFIDEQIQKIGKPQKDIANESGFDNANLITMIKKGQTKLPIAKVGPVAKALETDPIHLFKLCFSTYYPETWIEIEPFFESAFTEHEMQLIKKLRTHVGGPYLYAISDESKKIFESLMSSLNEPSKIH